MSVEDRKAQAKWSGNVVDEYPSAELMRAFRRRPFEGFDRRFLSILLVSFVVHFSLGLYFALNPPSHEFSQEEIERIQKRYVRLVLDRELPKVQKRAGAGPGVAAPPETAQPRRGAEEGGGEGAREGRGRLGPATAEARAEARSRAAAARQEGRAQIVRQASGAGVLALLTSGGGSGSGEGVQDVLGEVGSLGSDLDSKLSGVGGLRTTGAPGQGSGSGGAGSGSGGGHGIRGGRASAVASIDDLVSGLSAAEAASLTRSGDLIVSSASPVTEGKGGAGSRDPDAVSAVVSSHNAAIQYCYQRALRRNPDLKGKVVVRFTITPEGTVKNVEVVSSTLNDPDVIDCILSRIRRWDDFGAIDPSLGDATFRQVYAFGY
ncbi:MAG: TonB family protein [candidate division KSB1 bacterium]|nr:TonB family protein [candidate division KSB1 bacterium]